MRPRNRYGIRDLSRGQTTKNDDAPADKPKTLYTTERPDGLLVAHESRPVGFGPQIEEWTLDFEEKP
jgi:hypothetical protein